jgi:hypothetical protein
MAPEVKIAKNSKLPKLSEKSFELVEKGWWKLISTWINVPLSIIHVMKRIQHTPSKSSVTLLSLPIGRTLC